MIQIHNELENTILKKTNELELKQKEIFQQSKMAAMGEMISNIAHQWRQPLSVISTSASGVLIQDEVGILTKDNLHDSMEQIVRNTKYLSQTIDNFRNFFSPNKPKEIQQLSKIFEMIDSIFGDSLEVSNIKLIKNIENITLNTYTNELSQVIVNLIKNSKDAIEDSGIIIIDCFVSDTDDKIYIKVKDSGGGIPDEVIDKIYEPYFTTKHQSVGTGIGLNMSHQIITEHLGGEIKVHNIEFNYENTMHKGAEFIITLPKDILVGIS
jgi:signal transduction histidine kinase